MKIINQLACLAVLNLVNFANADTIVMKDGTKIEGVIVKEDATSYLVEVQVTSSIKDEKVLAKKDVLSVDKVTKDLVEFEDLSKLWPTPDGLPASDYSERIQFVQSFLKKYPTSKKRTEANTILTGLKTEAKELNQGGVKLNGLMIPADQYRNNAYDLDAQIAFNRIKGLVADYQYLQALRDFHDFEKDFESTPFFDELLPTMLKVISNYMNDVSKVASGYDERLQKRLKGLEQMSMDDRRVSEQAIADENAQMMQRFESQKASKVGWVNTHPFCKPTLDETLSFAKAELRRFETRKRTNLANRGKIFRELLAMIESKGDPKAITKAIQDARKAGLPARYITPLEAKLSASTTTP